MYGGLYLSYQKELNVQKLGDSILLGHAFSVHPDYPVAADGRYSIEEQILKWGGRFLVYRKGKIYTDATNSMGLFYVWTGKVRALSGSVHLLSQKYEFKRDDTFELPFRYSRETGQAWDFYPGPYTPYKDIKWLMQYEKIDFFADEYAGGGYIDNWNYVYGGLTPEQLTKRFVELAVYMLREIAKEYDGIFVPLTGGVDSRCVCALCKKAGIPFTTYTEQRSFKTHGSIFGVTRDVYSKRLKKENKDIQILRENIYRWLGGMLKCSQVHRISIDKWLEDIHEKGHRDMTWSNRFYFEQRIGSWLNDLNQAMDIIDFDRVSMVNNYEMLSILFAYPDAMRKREEHEKMIIEYCAPNLADMPVNPKYFSEKISEIYIIRKIKNKVQKLTGNKHPGK